MKRFLALLGCCFLLAPAVMAQGVSVDVVLDQDQYLAEESLTAKVRITNFSGATLRVGTEPDWLSLSVEDQRGIPVNRRAPLELEGDTGLESSTVGTRRIDLARHFDISRPGQYTVTASFKSAQWPRVERSKGRVFQIIAGTKLWEQEFGAPVLAGSAAQIPAIRKYSLLQTSHNKQLKLYVRLSSASESEIYKTFSLGQIVSFSNPTPQIDQYSNLHVLYQAGMRNHHYYVINPDGVMLARETYEQTESRPRLQAGKDGRIRVAGGVRKISPTDVPAPMTALSNNDVKEETKP